MAAALNPHRRPKLTPRQVEESRINRQGLTMKHQAQVYGVHHRTIEKVRYFESWREA